MPNINFAPVAGNVIPHLDLEEQVPVNYDKFKKVTESLATSMTSEAKHQERKINRLAMDLDLNAYPISTSMVKILATAAVVTLAVMALCAVIPFSPLLIWTAIIYGGISLFGIEKDAYEYLGIIMPAANHKDGLEKQVKVLEDARFPELNFLRDKKEFFAKLVQRVEDDQFTRQDLKAILYIREKKRLAEEKGQIDNKIDRMITDLETEWVTKTRVRNWDNAFREIA